MPDDPSRLGWWIGSALPGTDRGTVLIAGHVDTAEDGRGALFGTYDKTRLPAALFRRDTPPQLALVTCGGAFRDGAYDRNVVVYATPLG